MSLELLWNLGNKLCVDEENIIRKADEVMRLVQLHLGIGAKGLTDVTKCIISLDIASRRLGRKIDKGKAQRLATLTRPKYIRLLHTFETLLGNGEEDEGSIQLLATRLGCSELIETAENILEMYKEENSSKPTDFNFPVYTCAALIAAAKSNKVKLDKDVLKDSCRSKWSQVEKEAKIMEKFATIKKPPVAIKCAKRPRTESTEDEAATENSNDVKAQGTEQKEEYEKWKKRILSEAMRN